LHLNDFECTGLALASAQRHYFSTLQLLHRTAGFTAWSMSKAGFSMRLLKEAGFCIKDWDGNFAGRIFKK